MKFVKKSLLVLILLFILIYVVNIDSIPDSIILFQGEKLNLNTIFGINVNRNNSDVVQASSSIIESVSKKTGSVNLKLRLGALQVKDITVNVIPKSVVVPGGESIGLKLYTSGVLVVGMSEIEGEDNNKYKPYQNSGIEEGDMIIAVNNETITCTADLIKEVNDCNGNNISVKYVRDGQECKTLLNPVRTRKDEYKLGLWVRDAAAGVGTVTFYEPESGVFAALGHGILDVDTQKLINIAKGELVTSNIISIVKGEKGKPGEVRGSIENGKTVGEVYTNTFLGIYGKLKNPALLGINTGDRMEVLPRNEIKTGKAKIRCTLENNSSPKEYEIEIEKLYITNNEDNKSMMIRVTDKELLDKTGGIIQGMSRKPYNSKWQVCGGGDSCTCK